MTKKQTGSDKDQQSLNLDLGSAAFCDRNAMPETTFGYPLIEKYRVDAADNYRVRIQGDEYYGTGLKLSRSGSHGYTGTVMFEKIKTDSDDQVVDAKTNDRIMQIYSSVSNNEGAYCAGASIVAELVEDAADQTSVAGRIHFQPDGGNVDVVSIDANGIKFADSGLGDDDGLDWYEEGTWTPSFVMVSGAATFTYQSNGQKGYFTRVGNMVTVWYSIHCASVTVTTDGPVKISGLPYASSNDSQFHAYAYGWKQLLETSDTGILNRIPTNDDDIFLIDGASNYPDITNILNASELGNDRRLRAVLQYRVD